MNNAPCFTKTPEKKLIICLLLILYWMGLIYSSKVADQLSSVKL